MVPLNTRTTEEAVTDKNINLVAETFGPTKGECYKNGFDFNIVTGVDFKSKLFAGIGIGYLGFKGINGLSVFSDFEYLPLKTRMTPLINLKIGRSHIWNQYENGTGTLLGEFGLGLNFRMTEKLDIYTRSGFLMTQQSSLVPVRIGLRFSFIDE